MELNYPLSQVTESEEQIQENSKKSQMQYEKLHSIFHFYL
jgi:hypothetical protein